jgi:hypothetical protein
MSPDEIINALKAVFTTFSESLKYLRSRKCRKIIEEFLDQFKDLTERMSLFLQNMEGYLSLLNGILQTINSVLGSNICH